MLWIAVRYRGRRMVVLLGVRPFVGCIAWVWGGSVGTSIVGCFVVGLYFG